MLSLKYFIITIVIIIVLLFSIGAVVYEKRGYACYPDSSDRYTWGEKVEVLNLGSFHFYVTPLIKDCPEENRYDPALADDCGTYCSPYNREQ